MSTGKPFDLESLVMGDDRADLSTDRDPVARRVLAERKDLNADLTAARDYTAARGGSGASDGAGNDEAGGPGGRSGSGGGSSNGGGGSSSADGGEGSEDGGSGSPAGTSRTASRGAAGERRTGSGAAAAGVHGLPTHSSTGVPLDFSGQVPVRPATSVIMLREGRGSDPLEVFVQHRVTTMDFAAGVVVFPGGRVDLADAETAPSLPLDAAAEAAHLRAWERTDAPAVEAVVRRQVAERAAQQAAEAGLAGAAGAGAASAAVAGDPSYPTPVHPDGTPLTPDSMDPALAALGARALLACAMREVEEETGQRLSPAAVHPWANLVTPPGRSRRFDTYFYLTAGEELSSLQHQTTEATNSEWLSVAGLLEGERQDRYRLMRPTLALLTELHALGDLAAAMDLASSGTRVIESIRPRIPGVH